MGYFAVPTKSAKDCTIKDFLENALANLRMLSESNPTLKDQYLLPIAEAQINNAISRYNRAADDLK